MKLTSMFDQRLVSKLAQKGNFLQPLALGFFLNWLQLIKDNKQISPRFLGRAVYVSLVSFLSGPVRAYQRIRYRKAFQKARIRQAPTFILGHWRSGTTHLHNLLCQDRRF
jgi:hypothetical protein